MKISPKAALQKLLRMLVIILICVSLVTLSLNFYVLSASAPDIFSLEENPAGAYDAILILGCSVHANGNPSAMLKDRLERGISLYQAGVSSKIIVSGDHGSANYDEVNAMKNYCINQGVPSEDIFMDHAGFSTYESLYRARDIFECRNIIIVSQKYHLYRAVYIAHALGLDAVGAQSDYRAYRGQAYREVREILARDKDFFFAIFKPVPTFLGESIPVSGNGDVTNDKL